MTRGLKKFAAARLLPMSDEEEAVVVPDGKHDSSDEEKFEVISHGAGESTAAAVPTPDEGPPPEAAPVKRLSKMDQAKEGVQIGIQRASLLGRDASAKMGAKAKEDRKVCSDFLQARYHTVTMHPSPANGMVT